MDQRLCKICFSSYCGEEDSGGSSSDSGGSTGSGCTPYAELAGPMASTIFWCKSCVWMTAFSANTLGYLKSSSMTFCRELDPGSPGETLRCVHRLDRLSVSPFAFGE